MCLIALMKEMLPGKPEGKCQDWLQKLLDEEVDTLGAMKSLSENDWNRLGLPIGVVSLLRKFIVPVAPAPAPAPAVPLAPPPTDSTFPTITFSHKNRTVCAMHWV